MSDTLTTYLGLTKPAVGASRDTWGQKANSNFDIIDEFIYWAMPVGCVIDYAGANAPPGWLICAGQAVSRVTYSTLFAAIGVAFGSGDGSTTFNLPNCNGRALIGPGSATDANGTSYSYTLAQTAGIISQTIAQANLPNYTLTTATAGSHSHGGATAAGGNHIHSVTADVQGQHSHGGAVSSVGDHQHAYQTNALGPVNWGGPSNVYFGDFENAGWNTAPAGGHNHTISLDGYHNHNMTVGYSGNIQLGISADGVHSHTVTLGGGGVALTILSPILCITKIIYAGQQAAAFVMLDVAPTIDSTASEIEELREQVAELRALLLPRPRQRVLASPMRGSH